MQHAALLRAHIWYDHFEINLFLKSVASSAIQNYQICLLFTDIFDPLIINIVDIELQISVLSMTKNC